MKAALEAARERDWARCLSALLEVWRDGRDPRLAELVERVGAAVPVEPVTNTSVTQRITNATPADLSSIIAYVLREMRTAPNLSGAIAKLAARQAPDPRIAAALAYIIEHPPFAKTDGALYGDEIAALHAIDDPRFRQLILDGWARIEPRFNRLRKDKRAAEILKRVAAEVAKRAAPPSIDLAEGDIAEIDELLAAPSKTKKALDARELLQAIYDDPLDIGLRLVYADALLEVGDARGELISLQCNRGTGPITKRERELLKTYGRTWLGAIEPIVLKNGLEYRNGFVAKAREAAKKTAQGALLASPEWSTVEELDVTVTWGERAQKFLLDPRWKALRSVWSLQGDDMIAIGAEREMPWTSIALRGVGNWQAIARLSTFSSLVELDIAGSGAPIYVLDALAGTPLARTLERLRFPFLVNGQFLIGRGNPIADILRAARAANIAELDFTHQWSFEGGVGEILRVAGTHATLIYQSKHHIGSIIALVEQFPPNTIRTMSFVAAAPLEENVWRALVDTLQRQGTEIPARP